ncbi:MAG: CPBP family intramembrane metalloprotease [Ktedonobacteraceae bacterium]|nr:CPBP family intramembrane metalloprotease [Ktedonobacteraceae bacterium]
MTAISTFLAHLLALYCVFVQPVLGSYSYRRLKQNLQADQHARVSFYVRGIVAKWFWVLAVVIVLLTAGQSIDAIGLVDPTNSLFAFAWIAVFLLFILGTVIGYRVLIRDPEQYKSIEEEVAVKLLPTSPGERWLWVVAAVTAGVCEEVLYRGFLYYYFNLLFPGINALLLILLSGLIFGLGHFYQGRQGVLITGAMGALLMAAFVTTGSLFIPIVIHVLVDLRALFFVRPKEVVDPS